MQRELLAHLAGLGIMVGKGFIPVLLPALAPGWLLLLISPSCSEERQELFCSLMSLRLLLVGAKFLLGSTEVDVFKNSTGSSIFASSTVTIFFKIPQKQDIVTT